MDIETFLYQDFGGTRFDIAVVGGSLADDHDIKTAIILSLFTDRRAEPDDELPDPTDSRRGWVGDVFFDYPLGSRLWLLGREKQLPEVLNRAREYAEESLGWMLQIGVVESVEVLAMSFESGVLSLHVSVKRPGKDLDRFKFDYAWRDATLLRS